MALVGALISVSLGPTTAIADDCPNAAARTGVQRYLPDCRAYERVSPTDKNGFDIEVDLQQETPFVAGQAATDGSAVSFLTFGPLEGSPWGGIFGVHHYVARRHSDGWRTEPLFPRPRGVVPLTEVPAFSEDLRLSLLKSTTPLTESGADTDTGLYIRDELGRVDPVLVSAIATHKLLVASRDMSVIVLASKESLAGPSHEGLYQVYEYRDGAFDRVSRAPGTNEPFSIFDSAPGSGIGHSSQGIVSDDGRHIFFSNGDAGGGGEDIYRRTDGSTTTLVSPSTRTVPGDYYGSRFEGASADGSVVFFSSESPRTDDANSAGRDLYRYDIAADQLIDVTAGTTGDAPAGVEHVVGLAKDGRSTYFVATGQVVPGEGVDGLPNLYLWENDGSAAGNVRFIATLVSEDVSGTGWTRDRSVQATDDGRVLVFVSRANLTGASSVGLPQVYRYDATASNGATRLLCLSCVGGGSPGSSGLARAPGANPSGGFPRLVSEDGRRVVFSSENALVPRDSNGRFDAYLWQDGVPYLLSSGAGPDDSYAFGMSVDGDQVFFRTREALGAGDTDRLIDLYAAPIGGGFPAGSVVESCVLEDCRGPLASPPAARVPSSAGGAGESVARGVRARLTLGRIGAAQLRRAARTGVLRLRVGLSRPGRVTGVAYARLGSDGALERRRVARRAKRVGRAGSSVLALRLTPKARRALRVRGRLTLRLRVSLAGAKPIARQIRLEKAGSDRGTARSRSAQLGLGRGL